jgi:large conductance mechanosensitive channel
MTGDMVTPAPPVGIFVIEHGSMRRRECPDRVGFSEFPPGSAGVADAQFNHAGGHVVKGFRDFMSQGNLIQLAIAFVIGTAFEAIVKSLVSDLITPLIAAIGGQPNFETLQFTVNHSTFLYGDFVNSVVSFLVIAAVVYFLIVAPLAKATARFQKQAEATTRDCPECVSTIPIAATRCMYCTAQVPPVSEPTDTAQVNQLN